ncbi:MAG: sensor histidine kinase [Candidatus Kapaibacteriota bacterium]
MKQQRKFLMLWLGLMLYAAVQAFFVARSGSAPFVGVLIYNLVAEHFRFVSIIAMVWLAWRYVHAWQQWHQILTYVLWAVITSFALIAINLGVLKILEREQGFISIWNNKHWILLQNFLENALVIAGFVVAQYRHEIRQREERERELRLLNTQMELAALRAQINPHFLFNALNTVNALVGANPEQARRVLEMLADLLRYTLESDKRDVVRLSEELDFVRKYLAIEQERFGKRLRTRIEADETLLDAHIPPMLIQPLVENAVKHGISPKAVGGTVTVRVFKEADGKRLWVEVADDGSGMKTVKSFHGWASTGIGLANTDARLQKLFGKDSALHIESSEHGVTARFSVPLALQTQLSTLITQH